jgi:hypothetical protein
MLSMPKKWEEMPPAVKKATIFLLTGWAAHYIFISVSSLRAA